VLRFGNNVVKNLPPWFEPLVEAPPLLKGVLGSFVKA
jgi:hypothetical protein